jgi:succinate dehydrogenase/fumarate reductase flavoprotein subunit
MTAAYAAQAEGVRVLLIDRGAVGRGTNSALANGLFASPTVDYSPEAFARDTIQVGRKINNRASVRQIAEEALERMIFLKERGLPLKEGKGHFLVLTPGPESIPGLIMVKSLAENLLKLPGITVKRNVYITELFGRDRISGVKGFDEEGQDLVLGAPAVILATGGAGAIYRRNDNQKGIMGQGYALAAKAGLALWDMEFVQFYPLVLAEPRRPSLLIYPPYPDSLRLINSAGNDLLTQWGLGPLNKATLTQRDRLSILLYEEGQKGPVYLDCREVPEGDWDPLRLSLFKKIPFDPQEKCLALAPATHFFMGGLRTDPLGETRLPGLFACGEVAWGLHGANRRGGNALTECAVMGHIAGRQAALYARRHPLNGSIRLEKGPGWTPGERPVLSQLRDLRNYLRERAWDYAGILRTEKGLRQGLADMEGLGSQLEKLRPLTIEERRLKEDLLSGVLVLKAVLTASLGRQESRGSFSRLDFPLEDDRNWLKNSCLTYKPEEAGFRLRYEPVRVESDQLKDSDSI